MQLGIFAMVNFFSDFCTFGDKNLFLMTASCNNQSRATIQLQESVVSAWCFILHYPLATPNPIPLENKSYNNFQNAGSDNMTVSDCCICIISGVLFQRETDNSLQMFHFHKLQSVWFQHYWTNKGWVEKHRLYTDLQVPMKHPQYLLMCFW